MQGVKARKASRTCTRKYCLERRLLASDPLLLQLFVLGVAHVEQAADDIATVLAQQWGGRDDVM
jgi:hypothetical protein